MNLITEIPEFIDSDIWQHFKQYRTEMKKPLKKTTVHFVLVKLGKLHQEGEDVNACLIQSMENSWIGVFPAQKQKEFLPKDDTECVRFGAQKDIHAKPGESMWDYRSRLQAAL